MNKRIYINVGIFIAGVVAAMVYNYFYNMNGRYVPFRTTYKNVGMSFLDTRTGKIYLRLKRDGKHVIEAYDLQKDVKVK